MKLRSAIALAATLAVVPAGAAVAAPVYDARTLGMGGSSVGYSGNASLAYWNPASVGLGQRFGLYLPNVAFSFSNNVLSPADAMKLADSFQNFGKASSGSASGSSSNLFTSLGGPNGLNLQAELMAEPLGFSLGKVGPGNMALRVYGRSLVSAKAQLQDLRGGQPAAVNSQLAGNLNSLFFQGGLTEIMAAAGKITNAGPGSNQETLKQDVQAFSDLLRANMSAFYKPNAADRTTKQFDLASVTSANAAVAATYAQPLPLKIPALPEAQVSVGTTVKLLAAAPLSGVGSFTLPSSGTGPAAKLSPLGGGIGANIKMDIDKETTELLNAIDEFQKDQNLATSAELASKTGAFLSDGLGKSSLGFSNLTPDGIGFGMDLGAAMKLNKQWSVGASLQNPLLFWGATRSDYKYDLSGSEIALKKVAEAKTSYRVAEPMAARLGVAFQPEFGGVPDVLGKGLMLNLGLEAPLAFGQDAPFSYNVPPSVSLGVEKLLGPVALRLGTSQGGLAPLYTAGLGLQTTGFQFNLGAGVDSPSANARGLAVALSLGAGF